MSGWACRKRKIYTVKLASVLIGKSAGLRYQLWRGLTPVLRAGFAHLGRRTVIINPIMLQGVDRIRIGDDVLVRDGAWLATESAASSLSIGAGTYIGHRCHLHAIDPVSIGARCVLADNVMISSADHDRLRRHQVHASGPVVIGDDVFIGQNAVVLGGVSIGDGATVAAGAVVIRDVAAGAVVGGVPARELTSSKPAQ